MRGLFTIRLEDLRFFARIGVDNQERKVGNDFRVDLALSFNAENFIVENIQSTVSYAEVFEIVQSVMGEKWLLLESVSQAISAKIRDRWPLLMDISVKITKLAPPIPGLQGSASVEFLSPS